MTAVWYVGPADARAVPADAWYVDGVADPSRDNLADARWDASNAWSLPTASFTRQQLAWLRGDTEFYVGAPDGPRVLPDPPTTGQVRVLPAADGARVYGPGVTPVPVEGLDSGVGWDVDGPAVVAVREPALPSGWAYLTEGDR